MATLFEDTFDSETGLWTKVETVGTQALNGGYLEWTDPTGGWDSCARYATTGFTLEVGNQIEWWVTVKDNMDFIVGLNSAASVALATTKGMYFTGVEDLDFYLGYQLSATNVKWTENDVIHVTGVVQDTDGYMAYTVDGGPYDNLDVGELPFDHRQTMYININSSDTGGDTVLVDRVLLTDDGTETVAGGNSESMGSTDPRNIILRSRGRFPGR